MKGIDVLTVLAVILLVIMFVIALYQIEKYFSRILEEMKDKRTEDREFVSQMTAVRDDYKNKLKTVKNIYVAQLKEKSASRL